MLANLVFNVTISAEKEAQLRARMDELSLFEKDIAETFVCGSGKGGQKVNKTASCVMLKHLSTNVVVKCQKTRSRSDNRFFARRALVEKIEEQLLGEQSAQQKKYDKIRKQKKRRTRRMMNKNDCLEKDT